MADTLSLIGLSSSKLKIQNPGNKMPLSKSKATTTTANGICDVENQNDLTKTKNRAKSDKLNKNAVNKESNGTVAATTTSSATTQSSSVHKSSAASTNGYQVN